MAAELKAQRTWVMEELQRQHVVLEDARGAAVRADTIKELYPRLVRRIEQTSFEDKRFVPECMGAVVTVGHSGVT